MPDHPSSAATMDRSGLLAGGIPVPLIGGRAEAHVTDLLARVTLTQRYRNAEAQPIEAVYVFPLDERSAVCGFEAIVDGVHYVGEVKEREEAFRDYDDAIAGGHGAYLLDEERPDVFTASLGNVPPGAEVQLRLTYVTELAYEGEAVRFVLPTTVSPRYAPAEDHRGVGRPEAETLNPPLAWSVPYGLELEVTFEMSGAIVGVESPSHPISVHLDGTTAVVTLAERSASLDRDVVVLATAANAGEPRLLLERDDAGQYAAAVVFRPAFESVAAPSELVFVVDRSGSMDGSSIAEVRNALQLAIRSLVPGCRFNIVGFGSSTASLWAASQPYDEARLADASRYVDRLTADLGGTEILPALAQVLEAPLSGLPRQVVVLTDGEVTNADAVIALVRRHSATTRVFSFGIGRGASHHLVRGIARAGRGAAEFISPGERVEAKVMRQIGRLLSPALTGVSVEWSAPDVRAAPAAPPPVFAGDRVLVYAMAGDVPVASATLRADGPAGPLAWSVTAGPVPTETGRTLATLAARARIRDLEEGAEWLKARGSKQARRKEDGIAAEIVRLATAYRLASRETSFVAVEHRETPVTGELALRRVPIALTSGWGGFDVPERQMVTRACRVAYSIADPMMAKMGGGFPLEPPRGDADEVPMASRRSWGRLPSLARRSARFGARDESAGAFAPGGEMPDVWESDVSFGMYAIEEVPFDAAPEADARTATERDAVDQVLAVARLQRADGSWALDARLAGALGLSLERVKGWLAGASGDRDDAEAALATVLALRWLAVVHGDREDLWRPLAQKARRWLDRVAARAPGDAGETRTSPAIAWFALVGWEAFH